MKQVQNILGIFKDNFEIVQENTLKCSKLISFLGNKKLSLNQNVRQDHDTMQQNGFVQKNGQVKNNLDRSKIVLDL